MVDLLGYVGHVDEAKYFINSMKIKLDVAVWTYFLGACIIHKNLEHSHNIEQRNHLHLLPGLPSMNKPKYLFPILWIEGLLHRKKLIRCNLVALC